MNVQAIEDIWLVGDKFLREMFPALQAMKMTATHSKQSPPFVYEQFNIFYHFSTRHNRNGLSQIQHAIADAFNWRERLPKLFVMILDHDLLESLDYQGYGISLMLGRALNWISKQIEVLLDCRSEDLYKKWQSALYSSMPIVWVKMISRPFLHGGDGRHTNAYFKSFAAREKFNNALDDLSDHRKKTHVLEINATKEEQHFDQIGKLNQFGKVAYWVEFDSQVKKYIRKEIDLPSKPFPR